VRNRIFMFTCWTLLLSAPIQADTLITMMEGMGQSGSDAASADVRAGKEVQIWSRPDNMARVMDNGRMIFSIDRGTTYMIDDEKKTCRSFKNPDQDTSGSAVMDEIEIRKTGDDRRVGEWDTQGYAMSVPLASTEDVLEVSFWVTDEVTSGLESYRANFAAMTTPQTAWMGKTLELGGYPVLQESQIGQMTMWSEVLSVSEEQAPDGIYEVPAGYSGCTAD